jgi:hypothetical protein
MKEAEDSGKCSSIKENKNPFGFSDAKPER